MSSKRLTKRLRKVSLVEKLLALALFCLQFIFRAIESCFWGSLGAHCAPWMLLLVIRPPGKPLSLAANCSQVATLSFPATKILCVLKSISPIGHHYKRDVCIAVELFDPWRFHSCKTFLEPRKGIQKSVMSSQCKVHKPSGNLWVEPAGETLLRIFSELHTVEVNVEELFFGIWAQVGSR